MNRLCVVLALAVVLVVPMFAAGQTYSGQRHTYGATYNLSTDDQRRFDSYYGRWLEYSRTNNREETASMERRMHEIMARYNIPANTPFARVASPNAGGAWQRPSIPQFSPEDQRRFRSYYERWQRYKQTNNRGEVASMERRMQEVMSHYNVPAGVTYDDVLRSFSGRSGWLDAQPRSYGYSFPQFSADDARRFRSYYDRWQQYRRTNNHEEVASMEGRMRDVMAQYNLPTNMSFDDVISNLNRYGGMGR
jgi:hypothetical protein